MSPRFASITLSNGIYVLSHDSTLAISRVGQFTDMGFTTFGEWSNRLGESDQSSLVRQAAEQARERSLFLHDCRARFHSRSETARIRQLASRDVTLASILAYTPKNGKVTPGCNYGVTKVQLWKSYTWV